MSHGPMSQEYYFIGIGGAGMSVIAELFLAAGARVAGSDRQESDVTRYLTTLGARVYVGHDASQVPPEAIVVRSSAIRPDNPEWAIARERGQRVIHRSEALALASQGKDFLAVAGAHGKTTTSAMLAVMLREVGEDPSWAIGGSVRHLGAGGHRGEGSMLVAEADESDGSFLNYRPRIAIVTNVEPDHLDHYGSREAFEAAFVDFARCIVPGGLLIVCADDPGARRLGETYRGLGGRVASYGTGEPLEGCVFSVRVREENVYDLLLPSGVSHTLTVNLRVPGEHNRLNAASALLLAHELGIDLESAARGLENFYGAGRRFELRGHVAGVDVVDDYAHHPTEIRATLTAARTRLAEAGKGGNLRVLFQPHLFSRTRNFAHEFAQALALADSVVVCDIYPAREDPIPGVSSTLITNELPGARYVPDKEEAARTLVDQATPGDLLMTIGAGDVTEMADVIVAGLKERADA